MGGRENILTDDPAGKAEETNNTPAIFGSGDKGKIDLIVLKRIGD